MKKKTTRVIRVILITVTTLVLTTLMLGSVSISAQSTSNRLEINEVSEVDRVDEIELDDYPEAQLDDPTEERTKRFRGDSSSESRDFCIACFGKSAFGSNTQSISIMQFISPEIIGLVLGSFIISLIRKEFRTKGGSAPLARFVLGFLIMVSASVFMGCPLGMILRIAAGDLNAVIGFIGFALGVFIGVQFLKRGFFLGRYHFYEKNSLKGMILPISQIVLLIVLLVGGLSSSSGMNFETAGGSSIWFVLLVAFILGVGAQITRLCQVGSLRDLFMIGDHHLLQVSSVFFVLVLGFNLITNKFNLGFIGQPMAHSQWFWNFFPMVSVGLGSTLVGGCPTRQLVLVGTGDTDAAITVLGVLAGTAFAHSFGVASSSEVIQEGIRISGGVTTGGQVASVISLAIILLFAFSYSSKRKSKNSTP